MKGWTKNEIELLLGEAAKVGKTHGCLSDAFSLVSKKTGRAKGSVRNFYYTLMKSSEFEVQNLVRAGELKVEKNVGFSKVEEDALVRGVLSGVGDGKSVRRAIIDMSGGDGKLELRIQNKFRNLARTKPELIESVARELNIEKKVVRRKWQSDATISPSIKKVSAEIDNLVERIKAKYSAENQRLAKENAKLKRKVEELSLKLGISPVTDFFAINKKSV